MTSQVRPDVTCDKESAVPATPRRRWRRWILGAGLLLLFTSGLLLHQKHRKHQNHLNQLEQAANRIEIGCDWYAVAMKDLDIWGSPVEISGRGTRFDYDYGVPTSHMMIEAGYVLSYWNIRAGWTDWFHRYSQCPVTITTQVNSQGKEIVVGIRIRETRRRTTTPPAPLSSSIPE